MPRQDFLDKRHKVSVMGYGYGGHRHGSMGKGIGEGEHRPLVGAQAHPALSPLAMGLEPSIIYSLKF